MEKNKITVICENNGQTYEVPRGASLKEFKKIVFPTNHNHILGALVNNEVQDLHYEIYNPKYVNFIDVTTLDGYSIYARSLIFLLYKAIKNLYPKKKLIVEYYISNGIFCRVANKEFILNGERIQAIKDEMNRLVLADIAIDRTETPTEEAIRQFQQEGLKDKALLLSSRGKMFTSVYSIGDIKDYFYGTLAPSTGCLKTFDLIDYKDGVLLMLPNRLKPEEVLPFVPQEKLYNIFSEYRRWGKILEISNIGDLNQAIEQKQAGNIIKVSEALHEKKVSQIADLIKKGQKKIKVVLIAGPSSSGKTTFGKRLAVQLVVNGIKPVNLSLDNYFVNRENTPRDKNGEYDFEALEAMDLELLNRQLNELLEGRQVELPRFDFKEGRRHFEGNFMQLKENDILIMEGIHALNPAMTSAVDDSHIFRVYASALTSLSLDENNNISTSDNRLLRRIVRDNRVRGVTPEETILRWHSVRRGENRNIFPFQENADVAFNSALIFELPMLKYFAEPLLRRILPTSKAYTEAVRLLKFLDYIVALSPDEIEAIPPTSIMREFIGGQRL